MKRREILETIPNGPVIMASKTHARLQENLQTISEAIRQKSRELGITQENAADWHDNAAYDLLQQDLSVLEALLAKVSRALQNAKIISPQQNTSSIQVGNTVEVLYDDETDHERFTILGPLDNGTDRTWISTETDLAKAIIGKKEGNKVTMQNKMSVTIIKILAGQF